MITLAWKKGFLRNVVLKDEKSYLTMTYYIIKSLSVGVLVEFRKGC